MDRPLGILPYTKTFHGQLNFFLKIYLFIMNYTLAATSRLFTNFVT